MTRLRQVSLPASGVCLTPRARLLPARVQAQHKGARWALATLVGSALLAYGVWLLLLSATIVISLLFDARDIVLVAMGRK